jgi:hypothetical protein
MYLSTSIEVPSVKLYLFLGEFKIISLSREPEGIHSLLTCSPDIGVWARDSVGKRDEYCSISAIHLFQLGILIYVSYMLCIRNLSWACKGCRWDCLREKV